VRPAPLLAVAVSAVLGAVLGVGSGIALDHGGPTAPSDPLSLGISLQNQSCTDATLLVVATGSGGPQLAPAVAQNPDLRYLDTRKSCETAWMELGRAPHYAAYLGPYTTRDEACALRMTADYKGSFVTRLHDGNTEPVRCVCYQPPSAMPMLRPGMTANVVEGIWTRAMQRVLTDLHYLPKGHLTAFYDVATVDAVKQFQQDHGITFTGVVNATTWQALVKFGCELYTS
jgi:Putative peptidoglycan binding domain